MGVKGFHGQAHKKHYFFFLCHKFHPPEGW
nr:MAG TPA: hypothetical protein [Caudoviricetes sp.]